MATSPAAQDENSALEEVKKAVRAVLLSKIGGVRLDSFPADYRKLSGSPLKYREFGFASLREFLESLGDAVRFEYKEEAGVWLLYGIGDPNSYMSSAAKKAQFSRPKDGIKEDRRKRKKSKQKKDDAMTPKGNRGNGAEDDQGTPKNHTPRSKTPAREGRSTPLHRADGKLRVQPNNLGLYSVCVIYGGVIQDSTRGRIMMELTELFSTQGDVVEKNALKNRNLMFFRFAHEDEAVSVIELFDGHRLSDRTHIKVTPASEKMSGSKENHRKADQKGTDQKGTDRRGKDSNKSDHKRNDRSKKDNGLLANPVKPWPNQGDNNAHHMDSLMGNHMSLTPFGHLEHHMGPLGHHMGSLEHHMGPLEHHMGHHIGPIGNHMGPMEHHMGPMGNHMGPMEHHMGPMGNHMDPFGHHLSSMGHQVLPGGHHVGPMSPYSSLTDSDRPDSFVDLHVSNLTQNVTEDDLMAHFAAFQPVCARVRSKVEGDVRKYFAFVTVGCLVDAINAEACLHRLHLAGLTGPLSVEIAKKRPKPAGEKHREEEQKPPSVENTKNKPKAVEEKHRKGQPNTSSKAPSRNGKSWKKGDKKKSTRVESRSGDESGDSISCEIVGSPPYIHNEKPSLSKAPNPIRTLEFDTPSDNNNDSSLKLNGHPQGRGRGTFGVSPLPAFSSPVFGRGRGIFSPPPPLPSPSLVGRVSALGNPEGEKTPRPRPSLADLADQLDDL